MITYSDQGSYFGYKGFGKAFADEQGRLDKNGFYNVSFSNDIRDQ